MTAPGFSTRRTLVERGGNKWMLDTSLLIDATIANRGGVWEDDSTRVVQETLKPGMVVLDVGANIGYYSVVMGKLVGPTGHVLAFEPMREAAALAREHARMNGLSNVSVLEIALDDRSTDADGFFNYAWPLTPADAVDQQRNAIRARRLDDVLEVIPHLDRVDFVKIDVDGYEARLIRGATETLRRFRPPILLEVCEYTLRGAAGLPYVTAADPGYGDHVRAMCADLAALGYAFYREEDGTATTPDAMLRDWDLAVRSINVVCRCG